MKPKHVKIFGDIVEVGSAKYYELLEILKILNSNESDRTKSKHPIYS